MSGYPPQQPQYGPPQGQYPPQQGYGYPPQQPQMYPQQQPQVVIVKEEKKERGFWPPSVVVGSAERPANVVWIAANVSMSAVSRIGFHPKG
ncbi:hypothetical protein HYALB_00002669 [Hymenoscyphus albidus]|uniref:Uncharacterized protein n=1 Tax=Hymenoscyphus albidus TaxID=595503 RepID=A0A9N9Q2A5_9HELO|nr:hypothetical protein HYALB_00002669 [Hymenoscyphus albidus]